MREKKKSPARSAQERQPRSLFEPRPFPAQARRPEGPLDAAGRRNLLEIYRKQRQDTASGSDVSTGRVERHPATPDGGPPAQRVLEIGGHAIDPNDVFDEAFEHAGASAAAINNLIDVARDEEIVARFETWEEALSTYDEDVATDEDDDPVEIPKLIHFIWSGKPPTATAVKNILTWAAKAKNTGWRIILWTDTKVNFGNWKKAVAPLSGTVKIHDLVPELDPRLYEYYMLAAGQDPKALNMASDLARYSILNKYGGVYADVDILPGNVDLNKVPRLSKVDPPFLAPSVRDLDALKEQLPPKIFEAFEKKEISLAMAVQAASSRAYAQNQLNNNLIITQAGSDFMDQLIDSLPERLKRALKDRETWAQNAALITGPQAVNKKMFQYLNMPERLFQQMDPETFENWKDLEWITPESQNQDYGSKKGEKGEKEKDCFLTTACVEARGLPDDCYELATLRAFRDDFVSRLEGGPALIAEYYSIAPRIVARMKQDPDFQERAGELYIQLVRGSIALIEAEQAGAALELYKSHVQKLKAEFACRSPDGR